MTIERNVEIKVGVDTRALEDGIRRANAALRANLQAFDRAALATLRRLGDARLAAVGGMAGMSAPGGARGAEREAMRARFAEIAKISRGVFDPIGHAFDEMITGMLRGTQTFQMAWRRMAQNIVLSYVQAAIHIGIQAIEMETAKTAALALGLRARQGIEGAAMAESAALHIASALRWIAAEAGKVFAGVFGFLAPEMGPAAAAPAAASAGAALAGAGAIAFAARGYDVPADTLAYLHKREMVLPAVLADGVRAMATGAAPGLSAHIAVHAMDGASVMRTLTANAGAVAAALRRHARDLGPL